MVLHKGFKAYEIGVESGSESIKRNVTFLILTADLWRSVKFSVEKRSSYGVGHRYIFEPLCSYIILHFEPIQSDYNRYYALQLEFWVAF